MPDFRAALPASLDPYLAGCDVILHAGDATDPGVLDQLAAHAPVMAVRGNMDRPAVAAWGAPDELVIDIAGVRVAMLHDAGRAEGRGQRLRRRFPDAGLIVFGHSHVPVVSRLDGVVIVNPGSPTWKRRQPYPTFAKARFGPGGVDVELLCLPRD